MPVMDDDEIGYGKPPRGTRFKPGASGNPKGRPRRGPSQMGEIIDGMLDERVRYRENGRVRTSSRREVALKQLVERAMKGDVGAADILLQRRAAALRQAGTTANRILIRDWLPDFPGQTAEQKTDDLGHEPGSAKTIRDDAQ